MSIASEITRIGNNIADAYTSLNAKGATMPQVQNSDNLADTIDSVPTGGGGGGDTPAYMNDYNTMVSTIDSDVAEIAGDTVTVSKMEEQGYVAISSSYKDRIIGFVYDDKIKSVYLLKSTVLKGFKIPQSATYEYDSSTDRYKVTFSTERWLIYRSDSYYHYVDAKPYCSKVTSVSGSELEKIASPVCCYQYCPETNKNFNSIMGGTLYPVNEGTIKYLKTNATNITPTTSDSEWNVICGLENVDEFVTMFSGYNTTTKTFTIPSSTAKKLCNTGKGNVIGLLKNGSSLIFDLSGDTGTGTFTLIPSYSNYAPVTPKVEDLKIILPSTYTTVDLNWMKYNQKVGLNLTTEALSFMATNAPTVTSCTLKLGCANYGYLNYTTEGQQILSTFTTKGWTVTTV